MTFKSKNIRYYWNDNYQSWSKDNSNHRLKDNSNHRLIGPAYILPNGFQLWYKDGMCIKVKWK